MYYTGYDPMTMKQVYVPRSYEEKAMQRALLQFRNPQNHDLVRKALIQSGREDLIGYGPRCLVPPKAGYGESKGNGNPKDRRPQERKKVGGASFTKGVHKEEKPAKKTPRYAKKAKAAKAKKAKG